jgi:hypothetical protein
MPRRWLARAPQRRRGPQYQNAQVTPSDSM